MNEPRIIKKYPNRRLYDTTISSYITLEDVKELVIKQVPLKVVDVRSQTDITHTILLQIIIDQEETGPPLFTIENLQQMIRFYRSSAQQVVGKVAELAHTNLSQWQKWQEMLFQSFSCASSSPGVTTTSSAAVSAAPEEEEIREVSIEGKE